MEANAHTLVCEQATLRNPLNALEHHDKQLNYLLTCAVIDLTTNFGHDNLNHSAEHVLLVFNTLAVAYRVGDCLLEQVANRQKHLENSFMGIRAAVLGQSNQSLVTSQNQVILGALAVCSFRVRDQSVCKRHKMRCQWVRHLHWVNWAQAFGQLLNRSTGLN